MRIRKIESDLKFYENYFVENNLKVSFKKIIEKKNIYLQRKRKKNLRIKKILRKPKRNRS